MSSSWYKSDEWYNSFRERLGIKTADKDELNSQFYELLHKEDLILAEALKQLDCIYNFQSLYYPGSGWHKVPKQVLGIERVIHVSYEEIEANNGKGYFIKLGEGHKIKADYKQSPFKNNSFDATLIWGIPHETALEALLEFRRVTKKGGLLITSSISLAGQQDTRADIIAFHLEKQVETVKIDGLHPFISIYKNEGLMHAFHSFQ